MYGNDTRRQTFLVVKVFGEENSSPGFPLRPEFQGGHIAGENTVLPSYESKDLSQGCG